MSLIGKPASIIRYLARPEIISWYQLIGLFPFILYHSSLVCFKNEIKSFIPD